MKAIWIFTVGVAAFLSAGCVSKITQSLPGRYVLIAGGYSERMVLDLKEDQTYVLWHAVDLHEIAGEDRGSWTLSGDIVALSPKVRGTAQGAMFLPYHCAKLRIEKSERDFLLVSDSIPAIPASVRQRAVLMKAQPAARAKTTMAVTSRLRPVACRRSVSQFAAAFSEVERRTLKTPQASPSRTPQTSRSFA